MNLYIQSIFHLETINIISLLKARSSINLSFSVDEIIIETSIKDAKIGEFITFPELN